MDIVMKAKMAVLESACGICSLEEPELFTRLEELYWKAFKEGLERGKKVAKEGGGNDQPG